MNYFVVKYTGVFAFIKPWTAVRDGETFSQQFLTPSIIEGIEKKLFPELLDVAHQGKIVKIKRHRLNYQGIDNQQERTWSKGWIKKKGQMEKPQLSIIKRGVLLNPHLYLAFETEQDAAIASQQTICLCRNEDLLFPEELICLDETSWDSINGFELIFTNANEGFKVGYNRFDEAKEMYGKLEIFGNPIRE